MGKYFAPTAKRTMALSNNTWAANLHEKLTAEDKERLANSGVKTAVRYLDASGQSRYVGTSQLKSSQTATQ